MLLSYCTSCKGRLWQLQQVVMANLLVLDSIDAEWIIFDYHCPDNLFPKLSKLHLFKKLFEQEKVKMYRLTEDLVFSMPLAKNLAHIHGTGDYLFNLDADNFMGSSHKLMGNLNPSEFVWSQSMKDNGTMGRIGVSRKSFYEVGGYDLDLEGAGYDDIDFKDRLLRSGLSMIREERCPLPVQNTREDTTALLDKSKTTADYYDANRARWFASRESGIVKVNESGLILANGVDLTNSIIRIEG